MPPTPARTPSRLVRIAAGAVALLALLLPRASQAARGRDLGTGYEWYDTADGAGTGPGFFDGPVTTLNPADDAAPVQVTLPWAFPFYGSNRTALWISDNGWISFADPGTDAAPASGPLPDGAMPQAVVAPYWDDLDCSFAAFGFGIRHGRVDAAGAYRIQFYGSRQASGLLVLADVYLYQDGRIKFQYGADASLVAATVGIENDSGTDGFAIVDRGTGAPGVPASVSATYVVDILPPPLLAVECASATPAACGRIDDSLPGAMPSNIFRYACSTEDHLARERVYAVTLASPSRLRGTLTPGTGTNLHLFLLQYCSERACIRGPGASFDVLLAPGTYHVVVDAPAVSDEGSFTLQLDCSPLGPAIACGDTVSGDTTGGPRDFASYGCSGTRDLAGPEALYTIDLAAQPLLRATLTSVTADLDVGIFRIPATGPITQAACLQWGDTSALLGGLGPGSYLLAVDGVAAAEGAFTLETSCAVEARCTPVAGVVDFGSGVRQPLSGDTTLGSASCDVYACDRSGIYDGREQVYELVLAEPGQVAVLEPGGPSGHGYFILDSCDETTCAGALTGSCGVTLDAGVHYLVADSAAGDEGPFAIELIFDKAFSRWTACETPNLATLDTDTVRTVWDFNDGAYCVADPTSHNFPDGCTFAMYVTVRCGTEFHIPLFDVETGHLRVYDVFRGQYVQLTALSTSGWTQAGDDISWEDCTGQSDWWNQQTTDIWFRQPGGACGVYRLEFINHSGFVWNLYANCSGANIGGYPVYDSLCGAVAAYDPLPNLSLLSASAVVTCPDIEVTYELSNDGCAAAVNVPVSLLDNGTPVADDVVPVVDAYSTVTRTFRATFPGGGSTGNVTLAVDPGGLITECDEVPGSGCLVTPGTESVRLIDCGPDCDVVATGVFDPPNLCESGTAILDASGSTSRNCPGGALEYRLRGPSGTTPWQASAVFTGLSPAATTDYVLEARCADPSMRDACLDAVTLQLGVERPPVFNAATVAVQETDCNPGIAVTWSPATFFGPTGAGVYNVYRSTVSCADAVTPGSPTGGLLGTTASGIYADATTAAGRTYFYVVEAEDVAAFPGGCVPDGPAYGGATTRVDVPAGTCAGITDRQGPDTTLLPRIGGTLRVGAPDAYSEASVPMRWSADRALDTAAGEHFHVLRSPQPSAGFVQVSLPDPPLLQAPAFTDDAADLPNGGITIWYYLVAVANGCHADNRLQDP